MIEAVVQRCSIKMVFLEISQNSQENTWSTTLLKKRLWHRCFPVNFLKFLRTPPVVASDISPKDKSHYHLRAEHDAWSAPAILKNSFFEKFRNI